MSEFEAYLILGAIIAIAFIFVFLYAVWCFISSAVKAGTKAAINEILNESAVLNKEPNSEYFENGSGLSLKK